ncbi:MAG TPA: hypothetical protein VKP65_23330 [Rhodothermales bacterium]|nr:hypothetical protein [Rhodothermales bacterium]
MSALWLVQLLFGPLLLGHSVQGLYDLKTFVDTLEPEVNPAMHVSARCYHMRLPRVPIGLVFTAEEMEELADLLHGATVMHELHDMFDSELGSGGMP